MILSYIIASLHLIAFAVGISACWLRAERLRDLPVAGNFKAVFVADNFYGVFALMSVATGLWRAFGTLEKGSEYYLSSPVFHLKMGLYLLVFGLEIWPMVTLIRWRIQLKRGGDPDIGQARRLSMLSHIEVFLMLGMAVAAAAMARGVLA